MFTEQASRLLVALVGLFSAGVAVAMRRHVVASLRPHLDLIAFWSGVLGWGMAMRMWPPVHSEFSTLDIVLVNTAAAMTVGSWGFLFARIHRRRNQ